MKLFPHARPWQRDIAFFLVDHPRGQNFMPYLATDITFTEQPEGFTFPEKPSFSLNMEAAQELADMLWSAGIIPHLAKSDTSLGAVQRHLEDMRQLAFSKLSVEKPNARI